MVVILLGLIVRDIKIENNHAISTRKIKKEIDIFAYDQFDSLKIQQSAENIVYLYRKKGYIYIKVTPEIRIEEDSVDIVFKIEENERIFIGRIDIKIETTEEQYIDIPLSALPADFRIGKPFNPEKLITLDSTIKYLVSNGGYPYAKINIAVNIKKKNAIFFIHIIPQKVVYMRCREIKGLKKIDRNKILSIVALKTPRRFSYSYLEKIKEKLYQTDMFTFVTYKIYGMEREKDTLDVEFYLEESSPNVLSFGAGYQIPDRFLFSISWENLNIMHRLHNTGINLEWNQKLDKTFAIVVKPYYNIIYINSLPVNFNFSPEVNYDYEKTYKEKRLFFNTYFDYLGIYPFDIFSGFKHGIIVKDYGEDFTPLAISKSISTSINSGLILDSRENPVDPYQGIYLYMSGEITLPLLGAYEQFTKLITEIKTYNAFRYGVIAFRIKWAGVMNYGEDHTIPTFYLFSIGGDGSIRGYTEKSMGPIEEANYHYGNFITIINIEYRAHYIWKYLYPVVFTDMGTIDTDLSYLFTRYFAISTGIGLRYTTPIGPVRLDYAIALTGEKHWGKFYLGILHAF